MTVGRRFRFPTRQVLDSTVGVVEAALGRELRPSLSVDRDVPVVPAEAVHSAVGVPNVERLTADLCPNVGRAAISPLCAKYEAHTMFAQPTDSNAPLRSPSNRNFIP